MEDNRTDQLADNLKAFAITKVVEANELEMWTSAGWRLVAILAENMLVSHQDQESFPASPSTGSYNPYTQFVTKWKKMATHRYLLGLDDTTAHAMLATQLSTAKETITKLSASEAEKAKLIDERMKETEKLKVSLSSLQHDLDQSTERCRLLTETSKQQAGDMNKIRVAIGETQMKDILSGLPDGSRKSDRFSNLDLK